MSDFLIVGGGVIGMLMANELAEAGATVTLVERTQLAREASWAGGGIVSPLYPWRYAVPVTALASWSQGRYQGLVQHLQEQTGIDAQLRCQGLLMLAVDDRQAALDWAEQYQRPLQLVDKAFLYAKEPHLAAGATQALWMPEVASLRNPRLGRALQARLAQHAGVQVLTRHQVSGFVCRQQTVVGVRTEAGELYADRTLVAAGAWSGCLLETLGVHLPVEPVRGQMLLFRARPGLLGRVVLKGGRYLIPRSDGRILVGSTLERSGFDKATTSEARHDLHAAALEILPGLSNYPVEHHWAGLRPGSPHGIPFIGAVPGYERLYVNAGHFRNGLVLAPASARLLVDQLLGRQPIMDPRPYCLEGRVSRGASRGGGSAGGVLPPSVAPKTPKTKAP